MKEHPRIHEEIAALGKDVKELLQLGWTMKQEAIADCTAEEEEVLMTKDVANTTVTEDRLELDQVKRGTCSLHTHINEGTLMERPHDDGTCVSLGHLVDGPGTGRGKISLPMLWRIVPWRCTMKPCMEKQGLTVVAELVGVTCDLMVKVARARDKGGTR